MSSVPRRRQPSSGMCAMLSMCATLFTHTALCTSVTVSVATQSGVSAQDTVLVFYPLDATPAAGHDVAVIDQVEKRFVPRVNILRTGTTVTFPNSDRIRHQVYSFSAPKIFTLKLYAGSPSAPIVFDKPGLVILGCNIHDNMVAFVGVVDSPYFIKLAASGSAALNLPAGRYQLRVWHPNLAAAVAVQEISVQAVPLAVPVLIQLDGASPTVAPWLE
jgi:plastocyanin